MNTEILVFGDSIVYGSKDPEGGWVDRLKRHFEQNELSDDREFTQVFNLGIGGDTSSGVLGRFESELLIRRSLNSVTKVIFSFGVNDLSYNPETRQYKVPVEDYQSNLSELINKALVLGVEPYNIWICTITPVIEVMSLIPSNHGFVRSNQDVSKFNQIIQEFKLSHGIKVLNINSFIDPIADLDSDGLHPNSQGHTKIYNYVLENITKHLS